MATKKDVKKYLLEHSEVKVRLLGTYLDRYLNIIANDGFTTKIHIYDMFCGEGVYENGGEGSPLVILRAIQKLHQERTNKYTIPINCNFNDIEDWKINKLRQEIIHRNLHNGGYGTLDFTKLDYQKRIKELQDLVPTLKNEKSFLFIDPYGYKHIRAKDIKALLQNRNAEVLLFLPTQFMYRFTENGTPEALKDFIEELIDMEDWKTKDVWDFIDLLKYSFRGFLGHNHFVDTFTIQKDPQTVFCLFFFSTHIRGFEKMLESKWEIDTEQGKGWEYNDFGNSLFASQHTNVLEEKLLEYLKSGAKANGQIFDFTLHSGFLPKHTNEVLRSLQSNGRIKVNLSNGDVCRKGAFYINYDNYKEQPEKVIITLL